MNNVLLSRALIGLYSTAAKHWGTGDNCNGDDTTDDSGHAMTNVKLLEMRASKLEEQVRELTVRASMAVRVRRKILCLDWCYLQPA